MILAEDELAIGTEHDGIMVLDDALAAGTPLAGVLPIATDVLELEITPNRPDCLGVYGVAREVHAATGAPLAPAPWAGDPHPEGDAIAGLLGARWTRPISVRASPRACSRTCALGPSPPWLKARLMAAGQRPINNVVDITNYVMLLTGQPMHAFDADLVAGGSLVVRRARAGETMTTLDDVERTLDPEVCVIDDADGPTSIAGVMGGARSEVRAGTTRVLMEAATWNGPNIQRTSARLGLRTEASGRFEKQLQPEQGLDGQAVATKLMLELCGARAGRRHDRRRRPRPRARHAAAARRAHRAAARRAGAARRCRPHPGRARVRRHRGRGRARRDGAAVAAGRRRARGRPDRGGRAALGPRPLPGDAAVAPRRGRAAGAGAAHAPARRGRARRRRPVRGGRLELLLARGGAPARAAGRRRRAREPDVRGPVGDAHDPGRLAAGLAAAQQLARDRRRAPVRARRRLPAGTAGLAADGQPVVPGRGPGAADRGACTWAR